jgi:hypothetical protein
MFRRVAFTCIFLTAAIRVCWPEDPPAPTADRVGFPKDYESTWKKLRTVDDKDGKTVKFVYANNAAASRQAGDYPYGSILIIETCSTARDTQEKPLRDESGHFRPDKVTGLHVMRKERGFGEAYRENRTGEWEYVEYRPDGSYLTTPVASAKCATCHLKAGAAKDFVFGGSAKM